MALGTVSLIIFAIQFVLRTALALPNVPANARQLIRTANAVAEDSWYAPAAGYEKATLGSILKTREVTKDVRLVKTYPLKVANAWQLQYRTQNSLGEPQANVVTILKPHNPKSKNLFTISYLTNNAYAPCNPSRMLLNQDPAENYMPHFQTLFAVAALSEGWYVAVVDDSGPQAAQPSGLQTAYSTLDGIRALLKSGKDTGLDSNPITTMMGYSGGSLAIGWATEIQPTYAPELKIAGAAMGGLMTDMRNIDDPNFTYYTAFTPTTLLGLSHDYKNLSQWLSENLEPKAEAEFRRAEHQCTQQNLDEYQFLNVSQFFKRGYDSVLKDPIPSSVFKWSGVLGLRGTPKTPWYLFQNIGDKMSPMNITDRFYDKLCKAGTHVHYEKNMMSLPHGEAPFWRFPAAWNWLTDRHNGVPLPSECKTSVVNINSFGTLLPGESMLFMKMVWYNVLAMTGRNVGA